VSNTEFQESEYQHWKKACDTKGVNPPTLEEIERKTKDISEAMVHEFKEEDIEKVQTNSNNKTRIFITQQISDYHRKREIQDKPIQLCNEKI
jgi:hypothetical protein